MRFRFYLYLVIFSAVLIRLFYCGETLYLLLLLILLFIPVTGGFGLIVTLISFKAEVKFSKDTISKNENTDFSITINKSAAAFSYMRIFYVTPNNAVSGGTAEFRAVCAPGIGIEYHEELTPKYRGDYLAGLVEAHISDVFGFFIVKLKKRAAVCAARIIVLPDMKLGQHEADDIIGVSIDEREGHDGDMLSVSETRGYQHGDSLKRVHWKLSSRMRELYVRQYEGIKAPNIVILLDLSAHGRRTEAGAAYEDCIAGITASLCYTALTAGAEVTLLCYGTHRHELRGAGENDGQLFRRFLASVRFDGRADFAAFALSEITLMSGVSEVYFISDNANNKRFELLSESLAAAGISTDVVGTGTFGI